MTLAAPLVRQWFDLSDAPPPVPDYDAAVLARVVPAAKRVTLVTGPSGGGKSSLLAAARRQFAGHHWIDPTSVDLPDAPVIDSVAAAAGGDDEAAVVTALDRLARVGLAEAWTYLRTPAVLSDGQRWRLILALCLLKAERCNGPAVLAIDEFAALLDRVTAAVVARTLRRLIDATPNLSAIIVTSHDDLATALTPDVCVYCDFGNVSVDTRTPDKFD